MTAMQKCLLVGSSRSGLYLWIQKKHAGLHSLTLSQAAARSRLSLIDCCPFRLCHGLDDVYSGRCKRAAKFKADGKRKSDEHKFWWLVGASLRTDTLLVSQEDEHRLNFKLSGGDVCSTDSLDAVNDYLRVSERKRRICTSSRSGPTEVSTNFYR